jgi:hypothetical protein
MPTTQVPPFSGEHGDETTPGQFLKSFRVNMRELKMTQDSEKIIALSDYLKDGSTAEEWYDTEKGKHATWSAFETAFKTRFPGVEKVKASRMENEEELMNMKLSVEDLMKKVKYAGEDVYSHIVFADKAIELARKLEVSDTTNYITTTRKNLPDIIRDKVPVDQANWVSFTKAIKEIDPTYLAEKLGRYRAEKAKEETYTKRILELEHRLATIRPQPTTDKLAQAFSQLTVTPTRQTPNPTTRNAGIAAPRADTRQPRPPVTEEQRAAARVAAARWPKQPDTADGRNAYLQQLRDWAAEHGQDGYVSEQTGFPLHPSRAEICSGECFNCGRLGHQSQKCTTTEQMNIKERIWRRIATRALGRTNFTAHAQVNIVGAEEDQFEFAWLGAEGIGLGQGNGQGAPV